MKPKTIVTAALLLFVAARVVYLVAQEPGWRTKHNTTQPDTTWPQTGRQQETRPATSPQNKTVGSRVVAYYFHGNMRCMTCRTIESYAKEAVHTAFSDAIKDGRLEWRVVNVDEPGNGHFIRDFQLTTRSVVLERLVNGKRREWNNLHRVWELVRGDKEGFLKYIQDGTRAYLEAADK